MPKKVSKVMKLYYLSFEKRLILDGDFKKKFCFHPSTKGKLRNGENFAFVTFCPINNTSLWVGEKFHTQKWLKFRNIKILKVQKLCQSLVTIVKKV